MPRVFQVRSSDPSIPIAYAVERAVGMGCPNDRADVLLVQHLLRIAWNDAVGSKGFRPPGEQGPLKVDGIWGPTSQRFLKFFQEEVNRRGVPISQDQRVDPCLSGGSMGTISGKFYTILAMNAARNSRQTGNVADIAKDPGYPAELDRHFYVNW